MPTDIEPVLRRFVSLLPALGEQIRAEPRPDAVYLLSFSLPIAAALREEPTVLVANAPHQLPAEAQVHLQALESLIADGLPIQIDRISVDELVRRRWSTPDHLATMR